jgi:hypothetical protein
MQVLAFTVNLKGFTIPYLSIPQVWMLASLDARSSINFSSKARNGAPSDRHRACAMGHNVLCKIGKKVDPPTYPQRRRRALSAFHLPCCCPYCTTAPLPSEHASVAGAGLGHPTGRRKGGGGVPPSRVGARVGARAAAGLHQVPPLRPTHPRSLALTPHRPRPPHLPPHHRVWPHRW